MALPGQTQIAVLVLTAGPSGAAGGGELAAQIRLEPCPRLCPKGGVGGAVSKVHSVKVQVGAHVGANF